MKKRCGVSNIDIQHFDIQHFDIHECTMDSFALEKNWRKANIGV